MRPFFDRWYPALVRFLQARLGDRDQAEDIAQESFVRLLHSRPRYPRAWLFRVAENLARDEGRLARGRARHLTLIAAERRGELDPGPEEDLLRRVEIARVEGALRRIPERDRSLLVLHHAGFRYREIAEQVGVAPGSVGPLLTRAQRRFLIAYGHDEGSRERRTAG